MTLDQATDAVWWMTGNFAPITDELTTEHLPVEGRIPAELNGSYLRNGFNPPGAVPFHWFFGAGMVHGVELGDGQVSYRNRYVRTPHLSEDMDLMSAVGDLRASPANTNIIRHAGRLLALEEAHLPWEMGADLSTIDCFDFDGRLTTPMTAHPKVCPVTGELLFFGYQFMREPYLTYHRVDPQGQLVQSEVIEIPRPVMMHDFTITEHYTIFFDLPIVFSRESGFRFDRDAGGRIGVMPRTGTNADVTWYTVEPCTVFHALNSYERGTEIVIQVCRAASIMAGGMGDIGDASTLWQWAIDTVAGTVKEEQLDDRTGDFPRIDDRRVGLPARYGYVAGLVPGPSPTFAPDIYRYDLDTGTTLVHSFGPDTTHVFEPVFAPAGPEAAEDEGWIMVLTHDDATDTTTFNVLDAQNFTAPPVARVTLPQRVPYGAHGNWMPAGG